MTRPLRVALLTSNTGWRGSSVMFAEIARGLARRGHQVRALVSAPALAVEFAAQGVPVASVPIARTRLREVRAVRRALRDCAADVVLADTPRDLRIAALASVGRPLALVHCYNVFLSRPPSDVVMRLVYRRVRLIVFCTAAGAAQVLSRAPFMARTPHRVIPNGVDCDLFKPDPGAGRLFRRRHGLGDGPLLLAAGALEPVKRLDWLFGSLALLAPNVPPLVLCGAGSREQALRGQAAQLSLDVRFLGALPRSDLVGAYNAATCLVHAATAETFGLCIAEAMACGRPVLVPASGGPVEVVGTAGVLAPPEDPAGYATLLQQLLADPARRDALGAAARERVRERFSLERMVRDYGLAVEGLA